MPSAETAAMLFWALLASGQITMRKVDGWESLDTGSTDQIIDLAARCASGVTPEIAPKAIPRGRKGRNAAMRRCGDPAGQPIQVKQNTRRVEKCVPWVDCAPTRLAP